MEVPPQQASCHSVPCSGLSALENLLEFLRQLGVAVKVSVPVRAKVYLLPENERAGMYETFIYSQVMMPFLTVRMGP